MKNLNAYTQKAMDQLIIDTGVIFAFSNKQFDKNKKDGVKYTSLGSGIICPVENVNTFADGLINISKLGIAQDIKENGKEKIIMRELVNYECFYVSDYTDAYENLKEYNITEKEVRNVFNKNFEKYLDRL